MLRKFAMRDGVGQQMVAAALEWIERERTA